MRDSQNWKFHFEILHLYMYLDWIYLKKLYLNFWWFFSSPTISPIFPSLHRSKDRFFFFFFFEIIHWIIIKARETFGEKEKFRFRCKRSKERRRRRRRGRRKKLTNYNLCKHRSETKKKKMDSSFANIHSQRFECFVSLRFFFFSQKDLISLGDVLSHVRSICIVTNRHP